MNSKLIESSANFLAYVQKQSNAAGEFLFSDCAPLTDTAPNVAASAFYQCLVLSSRNLLRVVSQEDAYGEVSIQSQNP